uniref:Uncharacterized protein n=1 Tax=Arundo donax TaxID=35708 RepID=A0A0A9EKM0_ARUDO
MQRKKGNNHKERNNEERSGTEDVMWSHFRINHKK